jgi:hypothetical protein
VTGSGRGGTGNAVYRRNRALLLLNNDVCGICGHGGARTADHIVPARLWPRDENGKLLPGMDDLGNLRPSHGTMGAGRGNLNPCFQCGGRLCNQSRGDGRASRGPRRPQTRPWL